MDRSGLPGSRPGGGFAKLNTQHMAVLEVDSLQQPLQTLIEAGQAKQAEMRAEREVVQATQQVEPVDEVSRQLLEAYDAYNQRVAALASVKPEPAILELVASRIRELLGHEPERDTYRAPHVSDGYLVVNYQLVSSIIDDIDARLHPRVDATKNVVLVAVPDERQSSRLPGSRADRMQKHPALQSRMDDEATSDTLNKAAVAKQLWRHIEGMRGSRVVIPSTMVHDLGLQEHVIDTFLVVS